MKKQLVIRLVYEPKLVSAAVINALQTSMEALPVELKLAGRKAEMPGTGNYVQFYLPWQAANTRWYGRLAEAIRQVLVKTYVRINETTRHRLALSLNMGNHLGSLHCELNTRINAVNFEESVEKLLGLLQTKHPVEGRYYYEYDQRHGHWSLLTEAAWISTQPVAVKYTLQDFHDTRPHTRNNKPEIAVSDLCGCLYCKRTFEAKKIHEFTTDQAGASAKCPYCSTDAVIGSAYVKRLRDKQFMNDMNAYYEEAPVTMMVMEKKEEVKE